MTDVEWSVRQSLKHVKTLLCNFGSSLLVQVHKHISATFNNQQGLVRSAHSSLLNQIEYLKVQLRSR